MADSKHPVPSGDDLECLIDPCDAEYRADRRDFLKVTGLASAGLAAASTACSTPVTASDMPEAQAGPPLPTVPLGDYQVSRLIAGANPIYGYSHFNSLFSAHMREYHTTERVLSFLSNLERAGLNTWQASWSERLEHDWNLYKERGGKLQLVLLAKPSFNDDPALLERAVDRLHPIGVAQHGGQTRRLWERGQMDRSEDFLKRIHDTGVLAALSGHNPLEIEYAEEKGWEVDYYMTCVYEMNRSTGEIEKILGERPIGEIYLPSDPARMFKTIQQCSKPCLAYKALAAGRVTSSAERIREQLAMVYGGIKQRDALILGMYQRYSDQIGEDAEMVRGLLAT